jgi:hypothetical protein
MDQIIVRRWSTGFITEIATSLALLKNFANRINNLENKLLNPPIPDDDTLFGNLAQKIERGAAALTNATSNVYEWVEENVEKVTGFWKKWQNLIQNILIFGILPIIIIGVVIYTMPWWLPIYT